MKDESVLLQLLEDNQAHACPPGAYGGICVKIMATTALPSRFGNFHIVAFYNGKDQEEHVAIIKGNVVGESNVVTRLHSGCLTGDVFGSKRCDCRDQLTTSLKIIGKLKQGIILYLRQEGRGIGLINKIKAYALQDKGYDTFEADKALGFSGDERKYGIGAHMLFSLGIKSIKIMTNNPKKIEGLRRYGVKVADHIPLIAPVNKYNRFYLKTKKEKGGHLLGENL